MTLTDEAVVVQLGAGFAGSSTVKASLADRLYGSLVCSRDTGGMSKSEQSVIQVPCSDRQGFRDTSP